MQIDRYHQKAWREVEWWLDRLQSEGVDAVRATLAQYGWRILRPWLEANEAVIARFARKTRSQRAAMLRHLDATDRHLLLIAATHRVRCGYAWLQAASNRGADSGEGMSPLTMLDRASEAAEELYANWPSYWPFDDGTDPLDEALPLPASPAIS